MSEDGGDDTPPRPKRKIKKVMFVSTASESDSDESVSLSGTRRKRLRVLSDDESSDSSGSSIVQSSSRRRRTLPKLRDSDAESDASGWATDISNNPKPATSTSKPTSGFASDSSEGNSDKCSICLLRFTDQETGTPESCEHIFCFDCITEWSKNVNTCPVDRITFNSIVVRACAGGRVLRTEEVKVMQRRSSVEMLVFEDLTVCEICGRSDNEETMLLCDGCDMGYHMHCLTPPLTQIPIEQWLCVNCDDMLEDVIQLSEEDLFSGIVSMPLGPRPSPLRVPRNVRRSTRVSSSADQPSTSSGSRGSYAALEVPATSQAPQNSNRHSSSSSTRRRTTTTQRRKRKRRKAKTIVIEYEIEENGKFPITKRVTKRLRKRKTKRQPRTAARRTHVRASVRAKLATLKTDQRAEIAQTMDAGVGVQDLAVRRHRAGIPSLSLMGNPNHLDYFSDDENDISEAATTAVATRPTSNILSAYRQARRKMISIPSPTHASSAPDILSNILESQTLLHSKKSLVSISVDGNINIKLQTSSKQRDKPPLKKEEKLDLTKAEESMKKAPTYPGQSRGSGGWGGGYRGNYPRDHGSNGNFSRGGNYENNYSGNYQNRQQGNNFNNFQSNNRRDEPEYFDSFPRRPHQFPHNEDTYADRPRRTVPADNNRGPNYNQHLQHFQRNNEQNQGRHSLNASWPTYSGAPGPRAEAPALQARNSFGGFENPVDMRMSQVGPMSANTNLDNFSGAEAPRQDKRQPPTFQSLPESQPYRPLTQPPIFNFPKVSDVEKSEDEKSDSGLVIDTEKYDPTEPTIDDDDDSGDSAPARGAPPPRAFTAPPFDPPPPVASLPPAPSPAPPALPNQVQTILAGIDTSGMNVPHNILDDAVRQVLIEHRNLITSPSVAEPRNDKSDEDSDGDCPNFSIYSATSVHIANNTNITDDISKEPNEEDNLEDLIQEDDEAITEEPVTEPIERKVKPHNDNTLKKKSEEEYKEKVSKRCPITTNTRNPIKIKLNTQSLIKRQVSLYDEEEASQEVEETESVEEIREDKSENESQLNSGIDKSRDDVDLEKDKDETSKKSDGVKSQFRDTFTKEEETAELSQNSEDTPAKEKDSIPFLSDIVEKDKRIDGVDEKTEKPLDEIIDAKSPVYDTAEAKENLDVADDDNDDVSNNDSRSTSQSPKEDFEGEKIMENMEKMTESISETEDERSYTPCLDENKSNKDASFENDKDKGLEGLDTEMISEEEGNEMFSENEEAPSEGSRFSPVRVAAAESEEGEILDKRKERKKSETREEGGKKKKKKDSKKESKDKSKSSKKKSGEVSFKKLSKSGKERNYRERDKDDKKERDRRGSRETEARQKKRKEKRKDLERYDVRTVVTEKRRKLKDPFGRDVSPRGRSPSFSRSPPARSASPRRSPARRSPPRRSPSPPRRSLSPARLRRSPSRPRTSPPRTRRSASRRKTPARARRSPSAPRRSPSPRRRSPARKSAPRRSTSRPRRRRSASSPRATSRRRSPARRKRRRSAGASPPRRLTKKKKRARSAARRASAARAVASPPPVRPPSPRTPPSPTPRAPPAPRTRTRRRPRDAPPPSKEVFTSGDNILVSVSFKEQERSEEGDRRKRREERRGRRKRRRAAAAEVDAPKPVAIIDLERSPFRELTPSPKNVIVLSDSEHGEKEPAEEAAAAPEPAAEAAGPQTPPEPAAPPPAPSPPPSAPAAEPDGSPDAYDPFEPTRSASASPARESPPSLTLEAAQRSNLSADEVLARRPLSPAEKVLALLQSQRAASPEPPPEPRSEAPRPLPKLFPGKPSPIKSNPVKPMQAARLPRPPSDAGASPYSPGSSDFGELFEPPPRRMKPVRPHKKKGGKMQVDVKIDEENNTMLIGDLPSSAAALQVKSKFLKKLNRQERVVEEVKLVLKPHYNRKRVSKDDYKEILRRCVPKICHNKTGEINPTKIQALVEAYVKKFRKKHKLGVA